MSSAKSKLDAEFVRELAGILNDAELSEVEVEHEGYRIRVSKSGPPPAPQAAQYFAPPQPAPAAAPIPAAASTVPATDAASKPAIPSAITSPMVGTVYHAAEPGADAFVTVGDKVSKGDTLMLIEAMKTFNPVESPRDGTVKQIIAEDGQPVEFGEPLIVVE
ncbi:MAG: acetyl-CoA carboxylase biotin carboxyl carrier protein [Pseudomonadota bacterium]